MKIFPIGLIVICILSVAIFMGGNIQDSLRWNITGIHLIKGEDASIAIENPDCSHIWMAGLIAGRSGDLSAQHRAWEKALTCSPGSLPILRIILPQDVDLAMAAVQRYPHTSQAWFWLGEAIAPTNPLGARQAYLRTVELSPHHALAWCRLGRDYKQEGDLERAAAAFLNCCENGDPGSNGCYGVGRIMEELGKPQEAINYYRRSRWEGAQKRADELEKQRSP